MNINRLHLIATYVFLSVILLYTDPQIISQTLDQGVFYYAIENVATGEVLVRGQTNRWGILANELILGPTTRYREWLLDPQTGLVGSIDFSTGSPGQAFRIPKIDLHPPETIDFDGDGLSDIAEFILKTEADNNDTDGDGILDGAEVLQGLDPLINPANDGFDRFARTGILASADTPGNAVDVCAVNNIAVVAHGETGISVFNIFNGMDPVIIAQINTPGFARDVDCSGTLIAVADSSAGLAIIDISDPPAASIIYQRRFSSAARAIVIAGSIVYIGLDSGEIVTVELTTGSILDRFDSGETVYDFSIEGDQLFVLSASKLIAYTLSEVFLELSGSISTEAFGVDAITGRKRLFVGGNVAYVTAFPGFATYNVSDPASITPLGTIQQQGVTSFKQIVANGSGDGIAVFGNTVFDTTSHDIARLNIANPADTSIQLGDGEVGFNTPGIAHAVSLFNGLAYVADGNAGLQVINYRDFDGLGVAPNIELIASFSLEPPEAEEGKFVRITANVSDDVQVRNV